MTTSLSNFKLSTSSDISHGGNGKYKPLRRRNTATNPVNAYGFDPFNPAYDRMSFKSSRDPIFIAFDHVEKENPLKLTKDFIKDGITESVNTIGKTLINLFS